MMKYFFVFCCLILTWASSAQAADVALTLRAVELKAQPATDAQSSATLPENTQVQVLKRQGAWLQVRVAAPQAEGWLRMLSVRAAEGALARPADSGLGAALNLARTGSSGRVTVATGVRGLSEEDLKLAKPNPAELQKMRAYAANDAQARSFAQSGALQEQTLGYVVVPK